MTDPTNLDLNQRINLRGLVQAWQRYTVERFKGDLNVKLYGRKRARKKATLSRTYQLRNNWRMALTGSGEDVQGSQISFLKYGRFVDMGVGRGTDYALSKYQRVRANGERRTRVPIRWYSRRKGYETHRLRELLAKHFVDIPLETLETALTSRIELSA